MHIGLASLLAWRVGRMTPVTFSIAVNDYGLELLSALPVDIQPLLDGSLFDDADLLLAHHLQRLGQQCHGQQHEQHDSDGRRDDARKFKRDDSRGGGPRHDLRRGQRLSQEYRDKRYVVNDWKARHLNAPPRGHQWVRAGNDYVLAAIATGVITQILLSN